MVAADTSKKRGGRPGYRKPDAKRDRLSFKLSIAQFEELSRHWFEGEKVGEALNRLLEMLANTPECDRPSIELDLAPRIPISPGLRLSPTTAKVVESNWQGTPQATADYLLSQALALPVIEPIQSIEDTVLNSLQGKRVPATLVVGELMRQCSREKALQLIDELIEKGKVRAIDVQGVSPVGRIQLSSGRRLAYLELGERA
jgi:hypothetical protein